MSGGIELLLTDGVIDALVNELSEESCRDLLRGLLRERLEAAGQPVAMGLPGPGERVQIILDAVRGPLGDRMMLGRRAWREQMFDSLVVGSAAAEMMGMSRADHVWRAIARHGEEYPGRIVVVEIGRSKAVRRDDLAAFAEWYVANVRSRSPRWGEAFIARRDAARAEAVKSAGSMVGEQESGDESRLGRRAALRAAIARIEREVDEI